MATITRELVLVGAYAGQTVSLRGYEFVDGRCTLRGPESDVEGAARYLGKCFQAFEEGSLAHQAALARIEEGAADAETEPPADGEVRSDGAESPEGEETPEGAGDADPETGEEELPAEGEGGEGTETPELTDEDEEELD